MTAQDINKSLYRPILQGTEFDYLMPKPTYQTVKLATGNTKVAINEMAKWAKKYAQQTHELAPELTGNTLEETLDNIQWFLYWHINYSIDGTDQNLKSPAYAWATRQEGTDCKSYTIFASTILLNLGIKHYLRRIKQEVQSDAFTHVYVVIPKNQTTGKLPSNAQFNTDYFIIDGTIEYNNELPFTAKDDIYMESKLPIYGMAAGLNCGSDLGCGCTPTAPLQVTQAMNAPSQQEINEAYNDFAEVLYYLEQNGVSQQVTENAIKILEYCLENGIPPTKELLFPSLGYAYGLGIDPITLSLLTSAVTGSGQSTGAQPGEAAGGANIVSNLLNVLDLGSILDKLSCIGGVYDAKDLQFFTNAMGNGSSQVIMNFNEAIKANNFQLAAIEASKFLQATAQIKKHAETTAGHGWKSACSKDATTGFVETSTFYYKIAQEAFYKYLKQFFSVSETSVTKSTVDLPSEYAIRIGDEGMKLNEFASQLSVKQILNIAPNSNYAAIPGFEFTEYLNNIQTGGFNVGNFLNTLQQVVYKNPNVADSYVNENGTLVNGGVIKPQPQQAGMGTGMIVLLAGVAIGGVYLATKKK